MKPILIATDFSEHAARAVDYGAAFAGLLGAEIELFASVFISPLPLGPYNVAIPIDTLGVARSQATEKLEEIGNSLRERGLSVTTKVVHEDPSSGICARAQEIGAELVVLGTRGRTGLAHVLFGSVAERVARICRSPVLTAHAESPAPGDYRTLLVPTDFSEHAETAINWAEALAKKTRSRIVLLHSTYIDLGGQESLVADITLRDTMHEDARRKLGALKERLAPLEVETTIASTPADLAVLDTANKCEADLIVMGTRGRTGLGHVLLGSVAERVIRRAAQPVVTIKAAR